MFDRYAGDNSTQLPVHEKLYLDDQRRLTLPAVNLFSMLCAENTKSVCRQFFGKNGKTIGLGMASYVTITPFEIPICDEKGQITFKGFNQQVYEHRTVARLAKGVPNPKQRPVVAMPWNLQFTMNYIENKYCSLENLRQALTMGGVTLDCTQTMRGRCAPIRPSASSSPQAFHMPSTPVPPPVG